MTLRRALTLSVAALLATSLAAAAALVVLTSRLHRTTARLGTAMEKVQLAEESLVDLRAIDALTARIDEGRDDAEIRDALAHRGDGLRERLAGLSGRESTPVERELLEASLRSVERYIAVAGADRTRPEVRAELRDAFDDARGAIRRFLELNVERARGERATAARWDRTGDAWGFGAAALLVIGTAVVLALLRTRLFEPMIALAGSISRYGRGNTAERIPEAGFRELREIARSFNAVADRLDRQRDDQLAFLAGVAHDLRNPLSAIHLACQQRFAGPGSDRIRSRLDLIERQVKKLDRLAADFLDAARAEAGQLEIVPEPHDLRGLARAAAELFSGTSAVHRIDVAEPEEPLVVRCDIGRIEQVVNNLVSNAIKYSPDGGRVALALRRDGPDALFSVEDDGVGIAREDLTRIFEPFRRGSRLTTVVPGLGLGLATSRRIAERHGGSLNVSSAPGRGSTFELRLPLNVRDLAGEPREAESAPSSEGG